MGRWEKGIFEAINANAQDSRLGHSKQWFSGVVAPQRPLSTPWHRCDMNSLAEDSQQENQGFAEKLTETTVKNAKKWTRHKVDNQTLAPAVRRWNEKYGSELDRCSVDLWLQNHPDGTQSARPFETCKRRWCPICAWRRSQMNQARFFQAVPKIIVTHPSAKWAMLTLTVRNCPIEDLRSVLTDMNSGFRRLIISKKWPALGYIRSTEITFKKEGEGHPHFHVLLLLSSNYFTKNYVTQSQWAARWKTAMRLDYDPVIDIRQVKSALGLDNQTPEDMARGGAVEVLKYATKPSDLLDLEFNQVGPALASLRGMRFLAAGGVLKDALAEKKPEELKLTKEVTSKANFSWRANEWVYRRKVVKS